MVAFSNFKTNKLTTITFALLIVVFTFTLAACIIDWYKTDSQTTDSNTRAVYRLKPTTILLDTYISGDHASSIDLDWGTFELTRTHSIINAAVALCALSWLACLTAVILVFLVQIEVFGTKSKVMWLVCKIVIIISTVVLFMCVVVLGGGITPAFKSDIDGASTMTGIFAPCVQTCANSFTGNKNGTKFGPGSGWILALVALFFAVAASVLPWFDKAHDL
ncbi:hypothetical protein SAMD00019534_023840 [Acytostelium subglobosum LB1]|uniref:hypothetical protein n=1 Tax=Acytostelium subglobosum LB1 TaxID=1410327 RepID=UPI000645236C|nr:hypothetical protein SAMD00019534_023840 [Acytostelium subglobosum LB1]GAM19209.1 hypothetical protein SAMD00019534_023840 [Acytostelium subglobosum LB1]|eukprot:XP_012757136.1 hypothetical protein SAMD00019534_023840 [Acytostelium subglobosum LB1]